MIALLCPCCNNAFSVSDFVAGLATFCPACKARVEVQAESSASSAPQVDPGIDGSTGGHQDPARFRVLRLHAQGGLGIVSVALDDELHREVALKEIKEHHDDEESRTRFLIEGEITGRLEHPGVVPVYGMGHYPDGRPFYAMRLIKGDSLKEVIVRFHSRQLRDTASSDPALELRQLLARFITVCQTIQYAHDRGVLHRDIKPSNIMLGKYGETLVVDWGIAKVIGRHESAGPVRHADEPTLRPKSAIGSSVQTVAGSAVGTPQYMSPEQAAGRLDSLGPTTDIYSLGATLYCVLTGEPPIPETGVDEMLRKVQQGDIPRPRLHRPDLDPALEAICLKALALRPENRYATPLALAEDIERWLAGEPVQAWREPWIVRARRWVDRHGTYVTGAAAALVVSIIALAVLAAVIASAYETEKKLSTNLAQANEAERKAADAERSATMIAKKNAQEALQERAKAQEEARRAELALAVMKTQYYASQVSLARQEIEAGHARAAARHLKNTAPELRGWEYAYLRGLLDADQMVLRVHAGVDKPVPASDVSSGRDDAIDIEFSPDGRYLLAHLLDRKSHFWDLQQKSSVTLDGHYHFSPDHRFLYRSYDATVRLWSIQEQRETRVLKAPATLKAALFSPDGQRIVAPAMSTGFRTGAPLYLWNLGSLDERPRVLGKTDFYRFLAFDRTGRKLAAAVGDTKGDTPRALCIWDLQDSRQEPIVLEGSDVTTNSIQFSPDGDRLVVSTGSSKKTMKGRAETLALTGVLEWHFEPGKTPGPSRLDIGKGCRGITLIPGTQRIALHYEHATTVLQRTGTGETKPLFALDGALSPITCRAFDAKGSYLACGTADSSLLLWRLPSPSSKSKPDADPPRPRLLLGHTDEVLKVAFNKDATRLVSIAKDMTVRLWDSASGTLLRTFIGHAEAPEAVAFEPLRSRVVTVSQDGTVRFWDPASGSVVQSISKKAAETKSGPTTPAGATLSPDGSRIVGAGLSKTTKKRGGGATYAVREMDDQNEFTKTIRTLNTKIFTGFALSPDGKWLATREAGQLDLWDLTDKQQPPRSLKPRDRKFVSPRGVMATNPLSPAGPFCFSPNNEKLLCGTSDGVLRLWDVATGEEQLFLARTFMSVAAAFSQSSSKLVTAGRLPDTSERKRAHAAFEQMDADGDNVLKGDELSEPLRDELRRWDRNQDGVIDLEEFQDHWILRHAIGQGIMANMPKKLPRENEDWLVRIWNVESGQGEIDLPVQARQLLAVALSPEGDRVAVATVDGVIHLWTVAQPAKPLILSGHTDAVQGLLFTRDGSRLISAAKDGTLRFWEVRTGVETLVLKGHAGSVPALALDQTGTRLTSLSADGTIRVWIAPREATNPAAFTHRFEYPESYSRTMQALATLALQKELMLDKSQLSRLEGILHEEFQARGGTTFKSGTELISRRQKLTKQTDDAIAVILTPAQARRLAQLERQQQDASQFTDPDLHAALGLSADQKAAFARLGVELALLDPGGNRLRSSAQDTQQDKVENVARKRKEAFDTLSRGQDFFLIGDTSSLRESLQAFAKTRGITDGKITHAQFMDYREWFLAALKSDPMLNPGVPFSIKKVVQIRAELYAKAQSVLDMRQQQVWAEWIGLPAQSDLPELGDGRKKAR